MNRSRRSELPNMSAIATQFNPDAAPGQEIFAFYNDKHALLGFEVVKANSTDVVTFNNAEVSTTGFIRNPSQLAAVHFQNIVSMHKITLTCKFYSANSVSCRGYQMRVYAINDADSDIVLISPGLKDVNISTEKMYGSLAACGDGADNAWLFYLK
jgi:hypothetical protein